VLLIPMFRRVAGDHHLDQPVGRAKEAVGSFLGALEFQLPTLKQDGAKGAHQLAICARGEPEQHRATPRGEELHRDIWEHGGSGSADERSDIVTNLRGRDDGERQARRHLRPAPGEPDLEGLHAPFPFNEVGDDRAVHRFLVAVRLCALVSSTSSSLESPPLAGGAGGAVRGESARGGDQLPGAPTSLSGDGTGAIGAFPRGGDHVEVNGPREDVGHQSRPRAGLTGRPAFLGKVVPTFSRETGEKPVDAKCAPSAKHTASRTSWLHTCKESQDVPVNFS
jgi:hypothetical protein